MVPTTTPSSSPGSSTEPGRRKPRRSSFGRAKSSVPAPTRPRRSTTVWIIVFDKLRALQIPVDDDPEITVQNIVSSADLGVDLNLNAIAIGLGLENIEYEPEQFPGLVYRLDEPEVVALLFGSGKLVVTGGTEPADAEAAVDVITERLADLGLL